MVGFLYEIELKSEPLTPMQHGAVARYLNKNCKLLGEDTVFTTRFRYHPADDFRTRRSLKDFSFVWKDGDATSLCRREIIFPNLEETTLRAIERDLLRSGYSAMRSWLKRKREYEWSVNAIPYVVGLQRIEGYGELVEVEHLSHEPDLATHEPNLRAIIAKLGLQPADPKSLIESIAAFNK